MSVQVIGDQVDLDDYCGPERHKFVTCVKQTGNKQACAAQHSNYSACSHQFVREVGKLGPCRTAIAQFDDCRTRDSRSDCKEQATAVYNCYLKQ